MGPGLYVHVPICKSRCGYCDFYAESVPATLRGRFVEAILREAELLAPAWSSPAFESVFIGGGTPSALGERRLVRLLAGLRQRLPVCADAEWTVEVNPESAVPSLLDAIRREGVHRLSLGVQSFDAGQLERLGRLHDAEGARTAIERVRAVGFESINVDLIYGLPGRDAGRLWERSLREAIAWAPEHLSCYLLTLEPEVPMARAAAAGEIVLPGAEACRRAYGLAGRLLAGAGYERYEISNWSRPGAACRHNLNVWRGGRYLGLGPGAHGFDGHRRVANRPGLADYVASLEGGRLPARDVDAGGPGVPGEERLLLGLRLREGIGWEQLEGEVGREVTARLRKRASVWTEAGLLEDDGDRLRIADGGLFVSNALILELAEELEGDRCGSRSFMTG